MSNGEARAEAERVFRHLAVDFLTKYNPDYDVSSTYDIGDTDEDPLQLIRDIGVVDRYPSYLQPIFSPETGEIVTYEERCFEDEGGSRRSMSIKRAPDAKAFASLRGSSSNVPFLPGGFDDHELEKLFRFSERVEVQNEDEENYLNPTFLLDTPPEFGGPVDLSALTFDKAAIISSDEEKCQDPSTIGVISGLLDASIKEEKEKEMAAIDALRKKHFVGIIKNDVAFDKKPSADTNEELFSDNSDMALEETLRANATPKFDHTKSVADAARGAAKLTPSVELLNAEFAYAQLLDVSRSVTKYQELMPLLARKYPFDLDPFQQQAVVSMEEGSSVFVAAHTSAGKTVVAEYAIALCQIHKTRVIYTSPIKALSNQKFRDFKLTFDDVGLVTGDVQLNTDAFCLIMTTEILRSMVYNGSEVIRELEWVIFDEVHYINDAERGHVWEEVLIMLPAHVKIVMLSATVPNCMEFADWVGRIKNRRINVIQTLKRPVPLEHFLYTGQDGRSKKELFCILNKDGKFLAQNYNKAMKAKHASNKTKARFHKPDKPEKQRYAHGNDKNIYINLIDHLRSLDLLPMVCFIFSRKRCDQAASLMQSVDLTSAKEKSEIHRFFAKCIARLKGSDQKLPQLLVMQEHCKRGFAVHHSGILPIIKEVVELLFQRGYVKILFATETFAMGVNMPARTVVFDTIEKFDGCARRFLNCTEYVQMAGRAGRRGLDSTGTVIIVCKGAEPPELVYLTNMLMGKPIHLESKFRITYQMILNLLRVEQLRIEDMLQRSFVERNSLRLMLTRKTQMEELNKIIEEYPELDCVVCVPPGSGRSAAGEDSGGNPSWTTLDGAAAASPCSIWDYCDTLRRYLALSAALWPDLVKRYGTDKLFNTGRVLVINHVPLQLFGRLGVVVQAGRHDDGHFWMDVLIVSDREFYASMSSMLHDFNALPLEERKWLVESRLLEHYGINGLDAVERPPPALAATLYSAFDSKHSFFLLERVGLESLGAVCKQNIKNINASTLNAWKTSRSEAALGAIRVAMLQLNQLAEQWSVLPTPRANGNDTAPGITATWKPVYIVGKDITRADVNIHYEIVELRALRERLLNGAVFPCRECPTLAEHFKQVVHRIGVEDRRRTLLYQTSSDSLVMSQEYANRLKVLQALDYVDRNNMTSLKGKVACEINYQELLITELILENKFDGLTCAEIASMLSPLICQLSQSDAAPPSSAATSGQGGRNGSRNNQTSGGGGSRKISLRQMCDAVDPQVAIALAGDGGNTSFAFPTLTDENVEEQQSVEHTSPVVLERLKTNLLEVSSRIDKVQRSCGVHNDISDELNFGLMDVVYQWASGMLFSDIMRLTGAQEGIIVRCIQRLDEVCKDVRKAARIIGNPELYERMEETSGAIKRDIVFAASLYTIEE